MFDRTKSRGRDFQKARDDLALIGDIVCVAE
jgi:hypothetical protein